MDFDVRVEDRCVYLVTRVEDPQDLDIAENQICFLSRGQRFTFPLPVLVLPHAPLNTAKYNRRTCYLRLALRRPFASSTWEMFAKADKAFSEMQTEARRLFGPEVDRAVNIRGNVAEINACELRVEEGGGVVIDLESTSEAAADCPTIVLGDEGAPGFGRSRSRMFLPWAAQPAMDSSFSSECDEIQHDLSSPPVGESAARIARRIAQEAARAGLKVAAAAARRADGKLVRGGSVFTMLPRSKGEMVSYYRGKIMRRSEMRRTSRAQRYYFYLDDAYTLDGGTGGERPRAAHVAAYVNSPKNCVAEDGSPLLANLRWHVDPTQGLGQRAASLVATRHIAAHEELLLDYGDDYDLDGLSPESSDDEVLSKLLHAS